jgi:hypothetical protein
MPECLHPRPTCLSIYAGRGLEWCPDCGAFRRVLFLTAREGMGVRRDKWAVPRQVDFDLLQSELHD